MATLNASEQEKVDALAALEQAKWNNERYVFDGELATARQLVAYAEANAEARERTSRNGRPLPTRRTPGAKRGAMLRCSRRRTPISEQPERRFPEPRPSLKVPGLTFCGPGRCATRLAMPTR